MDRQKMKLIYKNIFSIVTFKFKVVIKGVITIINKFINPNFNCYLKNK